MAIRKLGKKSQKPFNGKIPTCPAGLPRRVFFLAERKGSRQQKICYIGRMEDRKGSPTGPWILTRLTSVMKEGVLCFRPTTLRGGEKKKARKLDNRLVFFSFRKMLFHRDEIARFFR